MHGADPVTGTVTPGQPQTVDVRPEIAPVRPGEELPWDRLAGYLVPALADVGVDVEGDMAVAQFPNGSANLTYLLTFGDHASSCCAARRSASSRPAPTT